MHQKNEGASKITIRSTCIYGLAALSTMLLGLFSRSDMFPMPNFVTLYVGDVLWAALVFWLVCMLKPTMRGRYQFISACVFAFSIEFSQLYQATWINDIRHTTLGALVLGFGFKWSDLVAYTAGISVGVLLNHFVLKHYIKSEKHDEAY